MTWSGDRELVKKGPPRVTGVGLEKQNVLLGSANTMRLPLIGQNGSVFIGNLGLFWVYFGSILTEELQTHSRTTMRVLQLLIDTHALQYDITRVVCHAQ